jgi:acyl carrier protein phosphodiesterase
LKDARHIRLDALTSISDPEPRFPFPVSRFPFPVSRFPFPPVNWLAHTFLSTTNVEFRLGNLLADLVRGEDRLRMSAEFQRGAACHKAIDAFTDSHEIVRRSRARVNDEYRRFSGVLMDVFYDYFLAKHWDAYSQQSLTRFTTEFYAAASASTVVLPEQARRTLDRIIQYDSLGSYRDVRGVDRALSRISTYLTQRWRKPFALERSISQLMEHEADLSSEFQAFFPQLQKHVSQWIAEHG